MLTFSITIPLLDTITTPLLASFNYSNMTVQTSPIEMLYDMRRDFTVIGLTGVAGSGCSTLAQLMSSKDFLKAIDDTVDLESEENKTKAFFNVRTPDIIRIPDEPTLDNDQAYGNNNQRVNEKITGAMVFKRKYSICYNFAQHQYKPFVVIKYPLANP